MRAESSHANRVIHANHGCGSQQCPHMEITWCTAQCSMCSLTTHVLGRPSDGGGCIYLRCKLPLEENRGILNARMYCNAILDTYVVPHFDAHVLPDRPVFMHDGTPLHAANATRTLFQRETTDTMDRPSRSPSLDPMEHLWGHTKQQLSSINNINQNIPELPAEIHCIWGDIQQAHIRRLIQNCKPRVADVITVDGDFIRYWLLINLRNEYTKFVMRQFLTSKLFFPISQLRNFQRLSHKKGVPSSWNLHEKHQHEGNPSAKYPKSAFCSFVCLTKICD